MVKKKLPENIVSAIEKWALKNCNTNEEAAAIIDHRIKRVSREIQEGWTKKEEVNRRVLPEGEYQAPSYRVYHSGAGQHKKFKPEGDRK
jgi:hypothetical protein